MAIDLANLGVPYKVHRLWKWLPPDGIVFGRHVFVKNPGDLPLLQHELIHVGQQARDGFFRYYLRYVFVPSWRVKYEAEAYAVQVRVGQPIDYFARVLSGPLYLWPCTREAAEAAIRGWL
ncbi:MAG: hypothetical protein WCK73_10375 [Deltaproteobacteria bacterium]